MERFRGSFVYDFMTEFVPAMAGIIIGIALIGTAIVAAYYSTFDPPTCRAKGHQMNIEVTWGFWQGCMGSIQGQWLPWGDIVPVEQAHPRMAGGEAMKLQSEFALLDVMRGRKTLDKLMPPGSQSLPDSKRIPVVIRGFISHRHGGDDGISQEFGIDVTSVEVKP